MPLTVPDFIGFQEGKQASLAADFSITQFKHLGRLLMVHGRNSYKRSAALSQFVIHRSLCISTMQVGGQPPLRAGAPGCPGESGNQAVPWSWYPLQATWQLIDLGLPGSFLLGVKAILGVLYRPELL